MSLRPLDRPSPSRVSQPILRRALGPLLVALTLSVGADLRHAQLPPIVTARVHSIPVAPNPLWSVLYAMPANGSVMGVTFRGTYDNRGSGIDAALARFELVDFGRGLSWTVRGSDLGWSGEGVFGPSTLRTTRFDGALQGSGTFALWETLNGGLPSPLGQNASLSASFLVVVRTGSWPRPLRGTPPGQPTDPGIPGPPRARPAQGWAERTYPARSR